MGYMATIGYIIQPKTTGSRNFNSILRRMNIYVGNLSYKVSDQELEEVFEEFGEVISAKVIKDRETGRSKGFGFVEMANDEDAQTAIEELDGAEISGRAVKVNKARPKETAGNKGGRGNYSRR